MTNQIERLDFQTVSTLKMLTGEFVASCVENVSVEDTILGFLEGLIRKRPDLFATSQDQAGGRQRTLFVASYPLKEFLVLEVDEAVKSGVVTPQTFELFLDLVSNFRSIADPSARQLTHQTPNPKGKAEIKMPTKEGSFQTVFGYFVDPKKSFNAEEIEAGLTHSDSSVRHAFASRTDYTPTPIQFERALSHPTDDSIHLAMLRRNDFMPNETQLTRGLANPDLFIRKAYEELLPKWQTSVAQNAQPDNINVKTKSKMRML